MVLISTSKNGFNRAEQFMSIEVRELGFQTSKQSVLKTWIHVSASLLTGTENKPPNFFVSHERRFVFLPRLPPAGQSAASHEENYAGPVPAVV